MSIHKRGKQVNQQDKTMGRKLVDSLLLGSCALTAQVAFAAETVSLTQVLPVSLPNHETELRLVFSGQPPAPQAYQIERPSRLVVDLPNTRSGLASRYQNLSTENARSFTVIDNQERTRMVINLTQSGGYTTRIEGNTLILKLGQADIGGGVSVANANRIAPEGTARPVVQEGNRVGLTINDVDFRRGSGGDGQVVVALSSPSIPVDVQQQGSKIVARFLGTKLPERLRRRLDVNDFNTPIKTIDAYNDGNNGVMVIQPQGDFEYLAYQADNKLTISVKPTPKEAVKRKPETVYTGQKLSLNFQDIEVRSVLQLIADFTNLNLVASDSVKDRITIRLQNVPWDQALDIILRTKGLAQRRNGNVIMIAPAEEVAAREKLEIQANQQVEQLAPLRTEYIQLSYARAADVQGLITSGRNNGSGSNGGDAALGSLLSSRGTVSIDVRTNTLIIQDTAKKIDEIRDLIEKVDVPVKQVMIEARIVRATNNFSKELGVKWGVQSDGIATNNNVLIGGSETTLFNLRNPTQKTLGNQKYVSYTIDRPDNLNVDLGVTSTGASRLALGLIKMSDVMLDLELSALQADGKGEIIATPKVLTTDKQKARVSAGTQIPYQMATSSGATAVQFINAELSLEVTPNITPDGRIGMDLAINSDTAGEVQATGVRAINTNRVATNVLIDDGQTVVLGGIFQNETGNSVTKVPFLGDLPYVGRLFKKDVQLNNKQELLIFVTPRLVNSTTAANR